MIGIIDYTMGNVQSVLNAFEYIGCAARIVGSSQEFPDCDKLVLPGVGAFGLGMRALRDRGLDSALTHEVINRKKPFLGICLGMQLICKESFEFGHHEGLAWIDASVRRFPDMPGLRVPHIGWNDIAAKRPSCLIDSSANPDMYFVHSYYVDARDAASVAATCRYGIEFAAMLERDNIFAAQFHPEKSQAAGLGILSRFARI